MEVYSRIPQKIFFRIGEVCELIKVQPHVLRYWETEFPMLTPQKNRAGQRVYRRKDVEMVMRIRDLLYEEKFTIAGAKKKLLDEIRSNSPRARASIREPEPVDVTPPQSTPPPAQAAAPVEPAPPAQTGILPGLSTTPAIDDKKVPPQMHRALWTLKRDLEDLLTLLKSNASISR
ncbi:MAG TPA: MerR family transcriptional regulator [Blastocatellia bacterium]|jgi:DNA-binding transcriptional MerR regulator|nr:MerR family transcriptional regulator [Blastocatellia bacterium]